jgi:hypothetical protein
MHGPSRDPAASQTDRPTLWRKSGAIAVWPRAPHGLAHPRPQRTEAGYLFGCRYHSTSGPAPGQAGDRKAIGPRVPPRRRTRTPSGRNGQGAVALTASAYRGPVEPCTRRSRADASLLAFVRGWSRPRCSLRPKPLTVIPNHAPCTESKKAYRVLPPFRRLLHAL